MEPRLYLQAIALYNVLLISKALRYGMR